MKFVAGGGWGGGGDGEEEEEERWRRGGEEVWWGVNCQLSSTSTSVTAALIETIF